ncbi:MAG: HAMP domain-containing protein [Acidobacteria bacterium]|nr:HAMP domain-containing protein [Acidobacteriota bacterium]
MTVGLRSRLLAAFVLVTVPPFLLLAVSVTALVTRSFEEGSRARLADGLRTARSRIDGLRRRAAEQVAAVALTDLPALAPSVADESGVAEILARRRELQALEIVGADGRVVSSHHWPAGLGLADRDGLFRGDDVLRLEHVAEGYGVAERLVLAPARETTWRGRPVTVRGGPFLDEAFVADLASLMGIHIALHDSARRRWVAPVASPLAGWRDPALAPASGRASLGGGSYEWAAAPLHPDLWLVVATPRTPLEAVTGEVRRLGLWLAAVALGAALVAAGALSGRIARPVRQLAEGARRVAGGDLGQRVDAGTTDEIGDLARAFNAMTADLEASHERLRQVERVAAWREMARRLAHELKNPLFPIQLSIETLRRAEEQGRSDFGTLFRESSDTILEELRSLRTIVEEFSDFARLPRPRLRATDLNEVVEQVLALYHARAAGVRVERALAPDLPSVPADRDLLARALGNLVANALEAMPAGGALTLRTARRDGAVVLEVEDTGPGLGDEQRRSLFTPYHTTKTGGTGLGLAIVQGIVADHGGRVEVRSEPGRGATFTVILPVS